jgi:hypothetical protein
VLKKYQFVDKHDSAKIKHQQLVAVLKSEYGYVNEKAVVELERLLRQFDRVNKSMVFHYVRPRIKPHQEK